MTVSPDDPSPDRRRFLMLMGLACAACAIPPATLAAPPPPSERVPQPPPSDRAPQGHAPAKVPSVEARVLVDVLRIRYARDMTEAKLGAIALDLDSRLEPGRQLRA